MSSCCSNDKSKGSVEDFSLPVDKIAGDCKIGEEWSLNALSEGKYPVLSCEGACVKGEIARRAANIVAKEPSCERLCHGETFFVPYSTMTSWTKEADKFIMIDGCFLKCHGRVIANLIDPDKMIHINAHSIHQQYGEVFSYDDIPDSEMNRLAKLVADKTVEAINC